MNPDAEFSLKIQQFLGRCFYLDRCTITQEEEFASERGWLSAEEEDAITKRNQAHYPVYLAETKNLWKELRSRSGSGLDCPKEK